MKLLEIHERWAIFGVVAFTAWGDQRLAAAEVSVARAVAEELKLPAEEAGAHLRSRDTVLGDLGLESLSSTARDVLYASAAWVALADGVEHQAERAVLLALRYRLQLDDERSALLETCAFLASRELSVDTARERYQMLLHAVEDVGDTLLEAPGIASA